LLAASLDAHAATGGTDKEAGLDPHGDVLTFEPINDDRNCASLP
jgi:hypothetical protein